MKRFISPLALLVVVVLCGFLLRFIGINWDDYARVHPDERFMTTIASRIGREENLIEEARQRCPDAADTHKYFNTDCSLFNPDNINEGSYVYGTLPLFMIYAAGQATVSLNPGGLLNAGDWATYEYIHLIGRAVSALADTLSILVVYLIGRRLFSSYHGLIAASLYAFAVLPIQLSHFWTVDAIAHLFFILGVYAAVEISKTGRFSAYLFFGLALGAALASRINLYPMLLLLPLAQLIYILTVEDQSRRSLIIEAVFLSLAALSVGAIAFRVLQPYAFVGPTISHWAINQNWLDETLHVAELSRLPTDGWPPSVQWFQRVPFLYAWFNMAVWGMGLALGLTATLAIAAAVVKQALARQLSIAVGLLTGWVIVYFLLTGGLHQMTMRYYLPLYASLCLLATWGLLALPYRTQRILSALVVGMTVVWAVAFVSIYTQPLTRVEASQWIEANLTPTIGLQNAEGQQVAARIGEDVFSYSTQMAFNGESYISEPFDTTEQGDLLGFALRFVDTSPTTGRVRILDADQDELVSIDLVGDGSDSILVLSDEIDRLPAGTYHWHLQLDWEGEDVFRLFIPMALWNTEDGLLRRPVLFRMPYPTVNYINPVDPVPFSIPEEMTVTSVVIPHVFGDTERLVLQSDYEVIEARRVETWGEESALGAGARFVLDKPTVFQPGALLTFQTDENFYLTGTVIATEGSWDDPVPIRFCEYTQVRWLIPLSDECVEVHPYAYGHFVHLPLDMAENDTIAKQRGMIAGLQIADYLAISSNRFYDALPRVPRRFSMSTEYYKRLFAGELGYELLQVFQRRPSFLGLSLSHEALPTDGNPGGLKNEIEAEEAFSVYDHPTVFIFHNAGFKASAFPMELPELEAVGSNRAALNLDTLPAPTYTLASHEISDAEVVLTLITWSLGFLVLGWLAFPIMYALFPALPLRGFMVGRAAAWLGLTLSAWWLTAGGITLFWTRLGVWLLVFAFGALSLNLAYRQRTELIAYIRDHWRKLLAAEILFLLALVFGLMLRAVAPDLWNIARGGEKPMDFAYLNSVLRTPVFPPPNPWLAGFKINYYYFGFVIAALPIKLGGYASEIGVNLALGTLYAVAFSAFFTLAYAVSPAIRQSTRVGLALVGTAFVFIAGNLGTLKLFLAPEPNMDPHRWYWYPTRILGESANRAGGAINEMPIFSFLFGDLHAHILSLLPAILYLIVLWLILRTRSRWLGIPLGILAGVLLMTNTWDILLYVPLGALVIFLATWSIRQTVIIGLITAASGILVVTPYLLNYMPGNANGIALWTQERSLLEPFFLVWGILIIIALCWLVIRLKPVFIPNSKSPVELGLVGAVVVVLLALPGELATSVLCLLMIGTALVLAWRDDPTLRFTHLGIALVFFVLLAIEHVVVKGDVGRMNTVFKVSFQLWLWVGLLIPVLLYRFLSYGHYALFALSLFVIGEGLLFPLYAIPARYADNQTGRITLNGNQFMNAMAIPSENAAAMTLTSDANLIHFMRANIHDFSTIAEWYESEYQWNSRISVQTGLPSVVGWANHLRQQYTALHPLINQRIDNIQLLYVMADPDQMQRLIALYGIDYIVFGELERAHSSEETEEAFAELQERGVLLVVFDEENTRLYQVIHPNP